MLKKSLSVLLATCFATCVLSGCSGGLGSAKSSSANGNASETSHNSIAQITIKVSNGASAGSPGVEAQKNTFKKLIEKNSKGKIAVEIYSDGQIGDDTKGTEACRAGDLECVNTSTAPLVGLVPELSIFDIPFLFSDSEVADKIVDGDIGQLLNKKLEEKGLINLAWNENGFRDVTNSKHVVKMPSDLNGLKIRTMDNQFHLEAWKDLGASPTPLSWSEIFTALQQHTVDGQENPVPNFYATHIQEVNKYVTVSDHIYSPFLLIYSAEKWKQLDASSQKIIRDAAVQYSQEERRLNREETKTLLKKLQDEGYSVTYLTKDERQAWKDKTAGVWNSVGNQVGSDMITKLKSALKVAEASDTSSSSSASVSNSSAK